MSLRAFAVLVAVAVGGAALLFGPAAALNASRWLRRRLGYQVPAPRLRPSPARWLRVRWVLWWRMARKGPVPRDGEPLRGPEMDDWDDIEHAARMPAYEPRRP